MWTSKIVLQRSNVRNGPVPESRPTTRMTHPGRNVSYFLPPISTLVGMMLNPVACDIRAAADPHILEAGDIVEQLG